MADTSVANSRADRPVTLAAIAAAHGVTGEVRLKLFAAGVASLKRYKMFGRTGPDGRHAEGALTVTSLRDDGKGGAIARFAEITDRTGAERLRGSGLTVPRSALPPLAPGEYYHADLIGLPAVSAGGEALGVVVAVENFGAGDVLEIERAGAEGAKPVRFMVPMKAEAIPEWNDARLVVAEGWGE